MKTKKDPNKYPKGWNADRVRAVLDYYERQSDAEAAKEIETSPVVKRVTWVEVPTKLLPSVRKLLARHRKSA